MRAEIQRIPEPAGCLRLWHDDSHGYGDPYQLSATVRWLAPTAIELMGLCAPLDPEMARAIKDACRRVNVTRVGSKRIKNGVENFHWLRVGRGLPQVPQSHILEN